MSSANFNKGPAYGLTAEVKNKIAQKYDVQKEEELRQWIEEITGSSIGPDFQKGLKSGVILCELINKLKPGSVKKINQSSLNWHQLENLTHFISGIMAYGLKPHDIFEANDLFENGNMTQVQTTLLALASMAKTKGCQTRVDIGVKYADKQERSFDEEKLRGGQCVIGLQMGTNKCASQTGMKAYGTQRHLVDPRTPSQVPMDSSTIGLQMGSNKGATQTGMLAPGTRRFIHSDKVGAEKYDNSVISLQMGYTEGANQSGLSFGQPRQIYDSKYCSKSEGAAADHNGAGGAREYIPDYQDEGYQGYQEEEPVYPDEGTDY
ncbi:unnamed protein product [Ophioblennius macclurei]